MERSVTLIRNVWFRYGVTQNNLWNDLSCFSFSCEWIGTLRHSLKSEARSPLPKWWDNTGKSLWRHKQSGILQHCRINDRQAMPKFDWLVIIKQMELDGGVSVQHLVYVGFTSWQPEKVEELMILHSLLS